MSVQDIGVVVDDVERAATRIRGVAVRTPLVRSYPLGDLLGAEVYLKAENLQRTGSFKFRGAFNAVQSLNDRERERGIITYSSGNHGQAVAAAGQLLGIRAVVVMPQNAISTKVSGVRGFGAEVVFAGRTSTEREAAARDLADRDGLTVIPPFDDARVIAGQGTTGLEMLEDNPDIEVVLVPVGGGGLVSGVATAVRSRRPAVRIFGVEPVGGADAYESLRQHKPVTLDRIETIADGLRTSRIGDLNFAIMSALLDGILLVEETAIYAAMRQLCLTAKLTVEPSGAVALAALVSGKLDIAGACVAVVLSGGNVDPALLAHVLSQNHPAAV